MHPHTPTSVAAAILLLGVILASAETMMDGAREAKDESERIVNGRDAEPGQFPWMVALYYNNQYVCSASIITPRVVLTAAHCLYIEDEPQEENLYLYHGIANVNRSESQVRIEFQSVTLHPGYNDENGTDNDVAVLITETELDLGAESGLYPVCIDTGLREYKKATAMGWGDVNPAWIPFTYIPEILQYAPQKIVPNSLCAVVNEGINEEKICAKGITWTGASGICHGDSGGPLVHQCADKPPVQIGIASYINRVGCGTLAPGVWTRLSSHYDFVVGETPDYWNICEV